MAHTNQRPPRSVTPPKGRPTPSRVDAAPAASDTVTLQWLGVGLAAVGMVAGLIYFGGDWGGQPTHGGGGGHGAPAVIDDGRSVTRLDPSG